MKLLTRLAAAFDVAAFVTFAGAFMAGVLTMTRSHDTGAGILIIAAGLFVALWLLFGSAALQWMDRQQRIAVAEYRKSRVIMAPIDDNGNVKIKPRDLVEVLERERKYAKN